MAVKIVTDSTSDITTELARELGITVIPLTVLFGRSSFLDRVEMSTDEFYRRLVQEDVFPTTTQPTPAAFAEAYSKILEAGDDVVTIVISSKLSGTFQSATSAINIAGGEGRIRVIDSLNTAMGLGLLVIAAAKIARTGADLDGVASSIYERLSGSHVIMLFDTLKYLARGGRIGRAQGLLGSVLSIKPILTVKNGIVHPLTRLRSIAAGREYLYNFVRSFDHIEELAVEHATTPQVADSLANRLRIDYPEHFIYRSTVSPVLGTYMGPNVLSVSVLEER
jgi:DegV family protein with EDD domain